MRVSRQRYLASGNARLVAQARSPDRGVWRRQARSVRRLRIGRQENQKEDRKSYTTEGSNISIFEVPSRIEFIIY